MDNEILGVIPCPPQPQALMLRCMQDLTGSRFSFRRNRSPSIVETRDAGFHHPSCPSGSIQLNGEMVLSRHTSIPQPRVLHGALLVAVVHIREPISLRIAVSPFEIVKQAPCVKGTDIGAVGYGARQFRQFLTEEVNAARIGNVSPILLVRTIEIAASALCNLNDGPIVLACDLHDEIVDSPRPYLQSAIGHWSFAGHHSDGLREAIRTAGRVLG